jgi:hypothetical protein
MGLIQFERAGAAVQHLSIVANCQMAAGAPNGTRRLSAREQVDLALAVDQVARTKRAPLRD